MSLAEQFKAWVAEQPPETEIDHTTYDTCACGAFARTLPETEDGDRVMGWDVAYGVREQFGDEAYNIIGNGGYSHPHHSTGRGLSADISTYGKLSEWLHSLTPVSVGE